MNTILEYVWLGANNELRSKTKVVSENINFIKDVPQWSFDGSSTGQAPGNHSDCILNPVKLYPNPFQDDYLVMCEVLVNGSKNFYLAHDTNKRSLIHNDSQDYWFGFEQEYVIWRIGRPLGWPSELRGEPEPQGPYYCGVGTNRVAGRNFVDEHMQACLHAELNITGTNAEVMIGQWEYQLFGHGAKESADDLWMSRYILERLAEQYDYEINYEPKPVEGDWNGSGLHTNFSTDNMRHNANMGTFHDIIDKLEKKHNEHIAVYGKNNDQRLTGLHETQSIDKFTYGEGDRGSSIRIPVEVIESGYTTGYLEDRRPAANANPYEITKAIIDTIQGNPWIVATT